MCMIYSLGDVSSAHFNPAVTITIAQRSATPCRSWRSPSPSSGHQRRYDYYQRRRDHQRRYDHQRRHDHQRSCDAFESSSACRASSEAPTRMSIASTAFQSGYLGTTGPEM